VDLPKQEGSGIKKYYNRLPSAGGGDAVTALNLQSSVNQKYQLLKKALDEKIQEVEKVKEDKGKVEKELGDMKEKEDVNKTKGLVDNIVSELKKITKGMDPEKEKEIVDILAKVGSKTLGPVLEVLQLATSKDKVGVPGMGMNMPPMDKPGMPPLPMKGASQTVVSGVDLPAVYPSQDGASLLDVVSAMLDHN
jgi:alanyl-tRNA synthetase